MASQDRHIFCQAGQTSYNDVHRIMIFLELFQQSVGSHRITDLVEIKDAFPLRRKPLAQVHKTAYESKLPCAGNPCAR